LAKQIDYRKQIVLPTLFGVEAATVKELEQLDLPEGETVVTDGQVSFIPKEEKEISILAARCNYNCRTPERVLIGLASFDADNFDALYDFTRELPWEDWLDRDYAITVTGYSLKSKLYGVPSMQSIIKKAIVDRLTQARKLIPGSHIVEDKNKGELNIRFAAVKDKISFSLDTSGEGLHKRGYRPLTHMAPIRETLAAAILDYLFFLRNQKQGEILFDPVCGSGTFLIEGAMMLSGLAPGLMRHFSGENLGLAGAKAFKQERDYAESKRKQISGKDKVFFGSDLSAQSIEDAKSNARRAGVEGLIDFKQADLMQISYEDIVALSPRALVVANPPYGERMASPDESSIINRALGMLVIDKLTGMNKKGLRLGVITADSDFEEEVGFKADKRRKLYNGMIPCQLYQYFRTSARERLESEVRS
jgi:putative N6-adenine-specific DNA methylase